MTLRALLAWPTAALLAAAVVAPAMVAVPEAPPPAPAGVAHGAACCGLPDCCTTGPCDGACAAGSAVVPTSSAAPEGCPRLAVPCGAQDQAVPPGSIGPARTAPPPPRPARPAALRTAVAVDPSLLASPLDPPTPPPQA